MLDTRKRPVNGVDMPRGLGSARLGLVSEELAMSSHTPARWVRAVTFLMFIAAGPWGVFAQRQYYAWFGGTSSPAEDLALVLFVALPPALLVGIMAYVAALVGQRKEGHAAQQ
jgi:hypothetical protein